MCFSGDLDGVDLTVGEFLLAGRDFSLQLSGRTQNKQNFNCLGHSYCF